MWLTDIHLNFLKLEERKKFYKSLIEKKADSILISGDIADALTITDILFEMLKYTKKPIYFVLGNHDYYHGSIMNVREEIMNICLSNPLLNWLPHSKVVKLNKNTALVGSDCWADGRYGDYINSPVVLNDSVLINELFISSLGGKTSLLDSMKKLADDDAELLMQNIELAINLQQPKKIIILNHVPPFRENCFYEGKMSSDDFLPFFSSKITGDMLLKVAKQHLKVKFEVLCGHTHHYSCHRPLDNLIIKCGNAEYLNPEIQSIIELKDEDCF